MPHSSKFIQVPCIIHDHNFGSGDGWEFKFPLASPGPSLQPLPGMEDKWAQWIGFSNKLDTAYGGMSSMYRSKNSVHMTLKCWSFTAFLSPWGCYQVTPSSNHLLDVSSETSLYFRTSDYTSELQMIFHLNIPSPNIPTNRPCHKSGAGKIHPAPASGPWAQRSHPSPGPLKRRPRSGRCVRWREVRTAGSPTASGASASG